MIKAPFNFVPLNERAYLPEWADRISQDVPFQDGISGMLELNIHAETPVFVCDKLNENNTEPCEFCNITYQDGRKQYFIPGSTIKGMLRNVMEILSFGKMLQVQNQSFGIRDLSTSADGEFYRAKVKVDNVHCGWLRYENDGYVLNDCGLPWRISAEELDRKFRMGLSSFIQNGNNLKSDENKTAQKKYSMFHGGNRDDEQLTDYFIPDSDTGISAGGRKFVRFGQGGNPGTIVFTGQPGVRKQKYNERKKKMIWSGKFFEFVFPEQIVSEDVPVPENVFKAFESIHQNSSDYVNFRRKELKKGLEIPVFFIYDKAGNVDTIGISYMYKFPAFNSVYNGIPLSLLTHEGHDLCECVFGFTGKKESLKGRVHISPALLKGNAFFCADTRLALAKPNPSYYPLYLGKGQTWNVENIRIAGRKRYPVRDKDFILHNEGTDNMSRIIRPLNQGSVFQGTIRFHNLRPIELGAILSAIDFCQNEDCFHSVGLGKPLGYGKVKLTLDRYEMRYNSEDKPCSPSEARKAFVNEMEKNFSGWSQSGQLVELFAMAKGIPAEKNSRFTYMKMSTTGAENEFKNGLKTYSQGEQLGTFTQILSGNIPSIRQLPNVSVNVKREDIELKLANDEKKKELMLEMEKERKEQELALQREKDVLRQKKLSAETIAIRARVAFANKNYFEAKKLFEEAASYNFDTYHANIEECKMKIDEGKNLITDISTFLSHVKLASIAAFANNLKKRNNAIPLTSNDIPYIIDKIKNDWNSLKPGERKNWLDRKKWSPIEKEIGTDMTDLVFNNIKSLPFK